jgi:hypothetical protein
MKVLIYTEKICSEKGISSTKNTKDQGVEPGAVPPVSVTAGFHARVWTKITPVARRAAWLIVPAPCQDADGFSSQEAPPREK